MASHASRFVKTPTFVSSCAAALGFALCQFSANAFAATACSAASSKVMTQTPSIECSGGAANCDPPIQPGVDPSTQSGVGPLTKCVFSGDDPPVTLRPDLGTGSGISFSGMGSTLQAGKCAPPIGVNGGTPGSLSCPVTQVHRVRVIPPYTPTPNTNLNQSPFCLSGATSLPQMPCGGAIPMLAQNTSISANMSVSNNISLGASITIGMPPTNLSSAPTAVANTLANGVAACGANSILSLAGNVVSLVVAPTNSTTPLTPATDTYTTTTDANGMALLTLPANTTYSWATSTNSVANDMITLPQGGSFTDTNGDIINFPPGALLINSGMGYVVWANGGTSGTPLQAVDQFGLGSFVSAIGTNTEPSLYLAPQTYYASYCTQAGSNPGLNCNSPPATNSQTEQAACNSQLAAAQATCLTDAKYVQQSISVAPVTATQLATAPQSTMLTDNAPGAVYTLDLCAQQNNGSCPVTYLTGQYIPVNNPMQIDTSSVEMLPPPPSTVTANTDNVTVPAGSYMSIPSGTPVGFNVSVAGTMTLPAGGSFMANGTTYSIPQGGVLTSLGGGQVQIPGSPPVTVTLPTGTTSINVSTTEVQVPAGVSVPVNINASAQVTLPQTPASNPPTSCR